MLKIQPYNNPIINATINFISMLWTVVLRAFSISDWLGWGWAAREFCHIDLVLAYHGAEGPDSAPHGGSDDSDQCQVRDTSTEHETQDRWNFSKLTKRNTKH